MSNHVHLIAVPQRADSLAVLLRRVHGRTHNTTTRALGGRATYGRIASSPAYWNGHLWTALAYVDRNPLRAGMVRGAADYRWSEAPSSVEDGRVGGVWVGGRVVGVAVGG